MGCLSWKFSDSGKISNMWCLVGSFLFRLGILKLECFAAIFYIQGKNPEKGLSSKKISILGKNPENMVFHGIIFPLRAKLLKVGCLFRTFPIQGKTSEKGNFYGKKVSYQGKILKMVCLAWKYTILDQNSKMRYLAGKVSMYGENPKDGLFLCEDFS